MKDACEEYHKWVLGMNEEFGATEVTLGIEKSLASEEPGRFHAHVVYSFVKRDGVLDKRQSLGPDKNWKFLGEAAHISVCTTKGKCAFKSTCRAHAYLQVRKQGQLYSWTNFPKGHDYLCEAGWVMQWWHLGKITTSAAREDIIENKNRVEKCLAELDFYQELMEKRAALELQRTCRDALGTCMLEFKRYAVMNRFMAEHKEAKLGKETRFKFMVCVGPPRMGKAQLCMSKYGSKDTFLLQLSTR